MADIFWLADHTRLVCLHRWIPSLLKSFDLESSCRVINEIGDLEVELTPLVLKGASMLEKAWYAEVQPGEASAHFCSEETPWLGAKPAGCKSGERRSGGSFVVEVEVDEIDEDKLANARKRLEEIDEIFAMPAQPSAGMLATLVEMRTTAVEELRKAKLPGVSCSLSTRSGPTVLVTKESHLYIKPDNPSLATITRTIVDAGALEEAIPGCIGWGSWGAAEDLGGIRVGGKVVISHLQRQWQALETWQRLTGSKRAAGQCPIVGSLERLLMASGCLEAKVRLNLGPRQRCYGVWTAEARLAFEARAPDAGPVGPAAVKLCQSLTQLVIRRLDDSNGPTNRAVATLDQATMLHILEQDSFPGLKAPKSERALLRMAVDWSSQPWRSKEAVEAVMAKIKFAGAPACFSNGLARLSGPVPAHGAFALPPGQAHAEFCPFHPGVPTRTLLHLDSSRIPVPTNTTLGDQLRLLADKVPKVEELMQEALEWQRLRKGTPDEEGDTGLYRRCFADDAPDFPDGTELYSIAFMPCLRACPQACPSSSHLASAHIAHNKSALSASWQVWHWTHCCDVDCVVQKRSRSV